MKPYEFDEDPFAHLWFGDPLPGVTTDDGHPLRIGDPEQLTRRVAGDLLVDPLDEANPLFWWVRRPIARRRRGLAGTLTAKVDDTTGTVTFQRRHLPRRWTATLTWAEPGPDGAPRPVAGPLAAVTLSVERGKVRVRRVQVVPTRTTSSPEKVAAFLADVAQAWPHVVEAATLAGFTSREQTVGGVLGAGKALREGLRHRVLDDAFLDDVAAVYVSNPARPRAAIAEKWRVPVGTTNYWIKACRDTGRLPLTTPGRKTTGTTTTEGTPR